MTGSDPPGWWRAPWLCLRRHSGRILLCGSVALAVAAAVVVALGADDTRLLRLGIVAALWAALLGTFAAVRLRQSEAAGGFEHAGDRHPAAPGDLDWQPATRRERELAAMERELSIERERREEAERRAREEIAALRGELTALQQNLRDLLGGDLLVERIALRAESTRFRSLPEMPGRASQAHDFAPLAPVRPVPNPAIGANPAPPGSAPPVPGPAAPAPAPAAPAAAWPGSPSRTGRHSRPASWSAAGSTPASPPRSARHTAHASGGVGTSGAGSPTTNGATSHPRRSVNELLTAHGQSSIPRHRRRRSDGG